MSPHLFDLYLSLAESYRCFVCHRLGQHFLAVLQYLGNACGYLHGDTSLDLIAVTVDSDIDVVFFGSRERQLDRNLLFGIFRHAQRSPDN